MAICNKDCFNCPYPDCILDEDFEESHEIDDSLISIKEQLRKEKDRARYHEYYVAHKEARAEYAKEHREKNREAIAEKRHKQYIEQRERWLIYQREYYQAHKSDTAPRSRSVLTPEERRERRRQSSRKYYATHREKCIAATIARQQKKKQENKKSR